MFSKSMISVAFLLASLSVCVQSAKTGGPSMFPIDQALVNYVQTRDLPGSVPCFTDFSANQADAVQKMGMSWNLCRDIESLANADLTKNLRAFTFEIAKIQNEVCVRIDGECRNKFALRGNITETLICYEKLPIIERAKIIEIGEESKLKKLEVENESRLIIESKKNCTNNANIAYLERSDALFENLLSTCENSNVEISTPGTIPTTPPELTSTTEDDIPITTKGRFPWN